MKVFFQNKYLYIVLTVSVIILVIFMAHGASTNKNLELVTTVVESGPVRELVSVSGIAKAEQTAELAFPVTGIIEKVHVKIGDEVEVGDTLITLDSNALYADRQDAIANLSRAISDRNELMNGPTNFELSVTAETLESKKEALETTKQNEDQKISNAYRTLLSTDLTAYSLDSDEDSVPPTITGTYECESEGIYTVEVFNSSAKSGYSYKLSGLENGTYTAFTDQTSPIGSCGLYIQFDEDSKYSNSEWEINIPNVKSSQYIVNRNSYSLAIIQAESAVSLAEQAVTLAEAEANNQNAPARSEALSRADASVAQAQAKLARIDSTIADRILTAPFAGTITELDILPGETVTPSPVVTLLASDEFEVTARIPEIDIGKLLVGQQVEMIFDAKSTDLVTGEIQFISLKSIEIDGVAYFEAIIKLNNIPPWIRSGLNTDIEIIINETKEGLRIPKRFITKTDNTYSVLVREGNITSTSTVEIILEGNDGFVSITGLTEGDTIVAP